jgi:hypothetical protein
MLVNEAGPFTTHEGDDVQFEDFSAAGDYENRPHNFTANIAIKY